MNELMAVANHHPLASSGPAWTRMGSAFQFDMNYTSAVFAAVVTIYYWWQNIKGIEESSDKALRVMQITTVMVVDPVGVGRLLGLDAGRSPAPVADARQPALQQRRAWLSARARGCCPIFGLFGIVMAFGHSILAMSGEESLAQVNREIEHPKLKNLKRAAIVIAIYSLIFTGGATLLASMLIPDWPAHPDLPGQPDRRPGHVHGRARWSARSPSASSWCWSAF